MKNIKLLVTIASILVFFAPSSLISQPSTIIISEVLYDTPLNESGALVHEGEFFSLYNYGNYAVDISGWQVEVTSLMSSTQVKYNYTFPDNTIISSNSNAVIASRAPNSTFEIDVFYSSLSTTGKDIILYNNTLTLPNTRSQIRIYNADNILQDEIVYDGTTAGISGEQLLRAENGQNLTRPGNQSASIQRKNITIVDNEHVFLRTDYHVHNPKRPVCFFSFDWYSNLTVMVDGNQTDLHAFNTEYGPGTGTISSNQNYIFTRTYFNSGTSTVGPVLYTQGVNNAIGNNDVYEISNHLENVQYFDGLGNLIEVVDKGASPSKKDIVSYIENDAYGQISKLWLPRPQEHNSGNFVNFSNFQNSDNEIYNNDGAPYSKIIREKSKQNRIIEQYGAGKAWHSNHKSVKTEYLTNVNMECRYYLVEKNNLIRKGEYEGNVLKVIKSTDEDGKELYEFKDNIGRTLMTRQTDGSNNYETYYVYDDLGYLRFVIPPKATDLLTTGVARYNPDNNVTIKNLCYTYRYDGRGNCIYKRLPGAEPIYYVYDKAGNVILSQNGEQRAKGIWVLSIPDKYNRVCVTGTCKNSFDYISQPLKNATVRAERNSTAYMGYSVTGISLTSAKILVVNYYDNYNFYVKNNTNNNVLVQADENLSYNNESTYSNYKPNAKTLLTGIVTAVLDDYDTPSDYLYSVMYYDGKKRIVQTKSTNAMGGYEKEYINYNFLGQPTKRKHIHTAENKESMTEEYRYTYDHASRLITTTHKLNDGSEIILSDNSYDEIGRLLSTNLNSTAYRGGGMERPQRPGLRTNYTYNVRGWLTGIYHFHVNEEIAYNNGTNPCWNGNISSTFYNSSNDNSIGLNYQYDGLNRLTSATNINTLSDLYSSSYRYDKNGNMLSLTRNDNLLSEDLSYSYYGNHLSDIIDVNLERSQNVIDEVILESVRPSLNDRLSNLQKLANAAQNVVSSSKAISGIAIGGGEEYDGDITQGDNPLDDPDNYSNNDPIENKRQYSSYAYDKIGNLIADYNSETEYRYNVLGLPLSINTAEQNGRINYRYDARGNKLGSYYSWNNSSSITKKELGGLIAITVPDKIRNSYKNTEYAGNKIYKDGSLDMILLGNGYIKENVYYFYIKDHLGNNIGVIDDEGNLVQQTFYHPYGKSISDLSTDPTNQPFKYGGKEEEGMFKLNLLDFHARQYKEPHFTTMDPFCEIIPSVSPYAYCSGNPINRIDPDGRFSIPTHAEMVTTAISNMPYYFTPIRGQILRGTGIVADIIFKEYPAVHLDGMRGVEQISRGYNIAKSSFGTNMSQGNYTAAGVNLHTIADVYSHSNYISLYSEYVGQSKGKLSYDIDKIPTFSEAMNDPDLKAFLEKNGFATGTFCGNIILDALTSDEEAHGKMNLDGNNPVLSPAGAKPYNEKDPKGPTMHDAAKATAQKDLNRTVGGGYRVVGAKNGYGVQKEGSTTAAEHDAQKFWEELLRE